VSKPALNPLTWLGRVLAVRAFVKHMDAVGYVSGSKAVGEAVVLAFELVGGGVEEAEAMTRLRALPGGRAALQDAAQMQARNANKGYPYGPVYRLLRASSGEPVSPPNSAEMAAEARQRQLLLQPLSTSFGELAEQVPALRELEQRAREAPAGLMHDLSAADIGMSGGTIPHAETHAGQVLILRALNQAVRQVVGPHSVQSDPVLVSGAARNVAFHYLLRLTGIDPQSWPEPHVAEEPLGATAGQSLRGRLQGASSRSAEGVNNRSSDCR
jgi:hypothetical protein